MSLFQARDWWALQCGDDEHFDHCSLCVANIDNSADGVDKVLVGSHSGILRVFAINRNGNENTLSPFRANDILLETDLQSPILQITSGMFLSATDKTNLAVLHPRKLCIYSISATAGVTDHGSAYNMLLIYEHNLQRSAYSLVVGAFGHVKGRDFLCVQCLDGALSFYEQESFAFTRFLPNFLLASPLAYVPQNDSFIVSTCNWSLESYRYQVLAIAKEDDSSNKSKSSAKKTTPDWTLMIGEPIIDIVVVSLEKNNWCAIVLGERNMFAVKESGLVWFMKKFDFCPISMAAHFTESGNLIVLIASEMRSLLIYNNDVLKWAAKLPFTPIVIRRATVHSKKGCLVCLSDSGFLCCCYLGTNPSVHIIANNSEVNITNYAEAEQELHDLRKIINTFNMNANGSSSVKSTSKFMQTSDICITIGDIISLNDTSTKLTRMKSTLLAVNVNLQSFVSITNVRLMVDVSDPISVEPNIVTFASIAANESVGDTQFSIGLSDDYFPRHLKFNVIVSFVNSDGNPKVSKKHAYLPLCLFTKLSNAVKEAEYSFVFDAQCSSSVDLKQLFSDVSDVTDMNSVDGSTINFCFCDNNLAAVGVSVTAKASNYKFRLKSNSIASLAFIASELIRRLQLHKAHFDKASFNKSLLPIEAYLKLIESHLNCRHNLKRQHENLATIASQFRALQKRLLVKLKDRNPTPLANLDLILENTHHKILNLSDKLIDESTRYRKVSNALSVTTNFLCFWLSLASNLQEEQQTLLNAVLTSDIIADVDEGWEERIETALITLFESRVKDTSGISKFAKMELSTPENTETIRKLITTAIEQIYSGDVLSTNAKNNNSTAKSAPVTLKPSVLAANDAIPEEDETENLANTQLNSLVTNVSAV